MEETGATIRTAAIYVCFFLGMPNIHRMNISA